MKVPTGGRWRRVLFLLVNDEKPPTKCLVQPASSAWERSHGWTTEVMLCWNWNFFIRFAPVGGSIFGGTETTPVNYIIRRVSVHVVPCSSEESISPERLEDISGDKSWCSKLDLRRVQHSFGSLSYPRARFVLIGIIINKWGQHSCHGNSPVYIDDLA